MPTAQDVLRTLVQLEGAETYIGKLSSMGGAMDATAQKEAKLRAQLSTLAPVFASIAVGGGAAAAYVLRQADAYDKYRNKLEVATKSASKAKAIFDWSKGYADATPFATGETVDAAARLEMYGLTAKKWLPMVGDMAGAMGKRLTDGVEAVADAISGGGMERLKEFGVSSEQLKKSGWTGSYQDTEGIESLKKALSELMSDRFAGGTAKMATTLSGKLSTLEGNFSTLAAAIGQDLMPQAMRTVENLTNMVQWLNGTSSATRSLIAEGIKFAVIAGAVGAVTVKAKQLQLLWQQSAALKAAATAKTVASQTEENAAVYRGVVAYNELAEAKIKAGTTPSSGPRRVLDYDTYAKTGALTTSMMPPSAAAEARAASTAAGGGLMAGPAGQWVKMAAGMMATTKAIEGLADASLSAGDRVAKLGAAAGYGLAAMGGIKGQGGLAIGAATVIGEAIAKAIDWYSTKRAAEVNAVAEEAPGLDAGGNPIPWDDQWRQRINEQYTRMRREGQIPGEPSELSQPPDLVGIPNTEAGSAPDWYLKMSVRNAQDRARKMAADAAEKAITDAQGSAKTAIERAQFDAETAAASTDAWKRYYERLKLVNDEAKDYVTNQSAIAKAAQDAASRMQAEATALDAVAARQREAAALERDKSKQARAYAEAIKTQSNADQLRFDAERLTIEQEKRLGEMQQRVKDDADKERKKASDDAKRSREDAIQQMQSRIDYSELTTGKRSPQTRTLQEELAKVYEAEATIAAQAGDATTAWRMRTEAVKAYQQAHKDLLGTLSEEMDVGEAYAAYLDAIGQKEQAADLRRGTLSNIAADTAQALFARGETASAIKAATQAEHLARSGEADKGAGLIGGMGHAGDVGARTNALWGYEGAIAAGINGQEMRIKVNTTVQDSRGYERGRAEDEYRDRYYRSGM